MHSSQKSLTLISKSTIFPDQKSTLQNLKLSVSDLPMLSCHYIQKGCLFTSPPLPIHALIALLKSGLSKTLSHFPPLAGRFRTDSDGHVYIICNDKGVDFIHANAGKLYIRDILSPIDVPEIFKEFFAFDRTVSFDGHFKPLVAVQITELVDGIFVGIAMNHAVVDGTSFWNFFNTFAEVCRGGKKIIRSPDFRRDSVLISPAVLKFPEGGPTVTFSCEEPLRERIFSFSREAILKLKLIVNNCKLSETAIENIGKQSNDDIYMTNTANVKSGVISKSNETAEISTVNKGNLSETAIEILGKQSNGRISMNNTANTKSGVVSKSHETAEILNGTAIEILGKHSNEKISMNNTAAKVKNGAVSRPHETAAAAAAAEVSSFLSLCALLWRSVTRARKLPPSKTTTFRMAINCRHRLEPKLDPYYFGNAIQSTPTWASSGDVTSSDLRWCAEHLSKTVKAHGDATVRRFVEDWERNPMCFPLGNSDGASITMGSSPRFPMYDNDFGWGRPMAVRSGGANKFDGKISAFPGREGGGSVDLEVVLAPETMAGIESDLEFMQYVSS